MASSSSSSLLLTSSLPPVTKEGEYIINWAELPRELLSSILLRLGAIEILESAQKVCRSWRRICKDPSMWQKIDMENLGIPTLPIDGPDLEIMCHHAVDRSQGGLVQIDIWHFGTDELLKYIAHRSSNLRSLKLVMCRLITREGFVETVANLPLLEDLGLSYCGVLDSDSLKVAGRFCPNLKTLKLHRAIYNQYPFECNFDALAIAETMPRLRHLELVGNWLSDSGLNAILDSCNDLEHLDLRQCFRLNLVGDLEKRCSEKIKVLRRPNDSLIGYQFNAIVDFWNSCDLTFRSLCMSASASS